MAHRIGYAPKLNMHGNFRHTWHVVFGAAGCMGQRGLAPRISALGEIAGAIIAISAAVSGGIALYSALSDAIHDDLPQVRIDDIRVMTSERSSTAYIEITLAVRGVSKVSVGGDIADIVLRADPNDTAVIWHAGIVQLAQEREPGDNIVIIVSYGTESIVADVMVERI